MARRNGKRQSKSRRSKSQRRGKVNVASVLQALIMEGLAVAAILVLFFGMRVDHSSHMEPEFDQRPNLDANLAAQDRYLGSIEISSGRRPWSTYTSN